MDSDRTAALDALRRGDASALGQPEPLVARARALLENDDPRDAEGLPAQLLELVARDAAERRRDAFLAAASKGPKALAKLVKKELYRLRSEGKALELPTTPKANAPHASVNETSLTAFLSPVDIDGRRTFIAPNESARGFEAVLGELSDVLGVTRVEVAPMPRREYRKFARELSRPKGEHAPWLELDLARFGSFVADAAAVPINDERARDGASLLTKMFPGTAEKARSRSWNALPAAEERERVVKGAEIFAHIENFRWVPDANALQTLMHRIDEVVTSRIVMDEAQRRQQLEATLDRCIEEYFARPTRAIWAERLFRQADYFDSTERRDVAELLAANARALESDSPVAEIPFTRVLFQKTLFEQTQAALERLSPEQREKLLSEERERAASPSEPKGSPLIVPGR